MQASPPTRQERRQRRLGRYRESRDYSAKKPVERQALLCRVPEITYKGLVGRLGPVTRSSKAVRTSFDWSLTPVLAARLQHQGPASRPQSRRQNTPQESADAVETKKKGPRPKLRLALSLWTFATGFEAELFGRLVRFALWVE